MQNNTQLAKRAINAVRRKSQIIGNIFPHFILLATHQSKLFLDKNWMDPSDEANCNPDNYFQEISYYVDLSSKIHIFNILPIEIYKVLSTCYYNNKMNYCPILITLSSIILAPDHIGIWDICFSHLVYTLKEEGENPFVYIVNLEYNNMTIRVKNLILDPQINKISFYKEFLYSASDFSIDITHIRKQTFSPDQIITLDVNDPTQVLRRIHIKERILALSIYGKDQAFIFESPDNQIEIYKINLIKFDNDSLFDYKFEQLKEVAPRKNPSVDPISKFKFIIHEGNMFGVTLRKSSSIDLYWNWVIVESVTDCKIFRNNFLEYIKDITMSMNSFFFLKSTGGVVGFEHNGNAQLSFDSAKKIQTKDFNFEQVFLKIIQNIVKLYSGHEILCLFTHIDEHKKEQQAILCVNGDIYIGITDKHVLDKAYKLQPTHHISGEIIRWDADYQYNDTLYIFVIENNEYRFDVLVRNQLKKVDQLTEIDKDSNLLIFQSDDSKKYILLQKEEDLTLYTQEIVQHQGQDAQIQLQEIKKIPMKKKKIGGMIHSGCSSDVDKHFFIFDEKNMYLIEILPDENEITTFPFVYCVGVQSFNSQFNYAICQEGPGAQFPGLRLFNMETILRRKVLKMTLLKRIDIGTLGNFVHGTHLQRIGFMNSITNIIISPILHSNANKFFGIKHMPDYRLVNILDEMYYAFYKDCIYSWDLYTGKFISKVAVKNFSLETYTNVSKNQLGKVLFMSNELIQPDQLNEAEFYFPWQLQPNIEKSLTFQQATKKSYRKFIYAEIVSSNQVKIYLEFTHVSYEKQRIFFNKSMDKMITILDNYRTFLYQIESQGLENDYKVQTKLIRQIKGFPNSLDNDEKYLEFFSPCFSRYLTFDQKKRLFIIRNNLDGKRLFEIPEDILSAEKEDSNLKWSTNRIKFIDASTIKIVNEDGVECIYDIDNNFEQKAFNVIPLFNKVDGIEYQEYHYYVQRNKLPPTQLLKRLQRIYQNYKSEKLLKKAATVDDLLLVMFNVDRADLSLQETSFTYLHWSLIYQLKHDKIQLDDLEPSVIHSLIYNILPGGETIFHALCGQKDELQKLMEACHSDEAIIYHLPFIPNFKGMTPIHKLVGSMDFRSINMVLRYLAFYEIDHHSRFIQNIYYKFIEQELPNFIPYLQQNLKQTPSLAKKDRGLLKEDYPSVLPAKIWYREEEINEQIFYKDNLKVMSSVRLDFIDLPGLYHYLDPNFKAFIHELADTTNFEYFTIPSIQSIIEFNYELVQRYIIYVIIVPYLVFHGIFVCYMNLVYEHRTEDEYYQHVNKAICILMALFSIYFLFSEMRQLISQGFQYLSNVWNYIDLLSPIGVITFLILELLSQLEYEVNQDFLRSIMALATFFMWLKILYVLRIFRSTGYLIRSIVEVIYDMGIFLLILFLTVTAFGDSFLRLSLGNEEGFIENFFFSIVYAYRMILGDFDTTNFGDVARPLAFVFWFMCTIVDMIVMLNLLIAIISATYERVANNSEKAAYQEMAKLIDENQYLIPAYIKKSYAPLGQYLILVTNEEKVVEKSGDPVFHKLNSLEQLTEDLTKTQKTIQDKLIKHHKQFKAFTRELNQKKLKKNIGEFPAFLFRIHGHQLYKMTIRQYKESSKQKGTGVHCSGRKFAKCQSGMLATQTQYKTQDNDVIYHCFKCQFDYCDQCYKYYGSNSHQHQLVQTNYGEVKKLAAYQNGWLCDARFYVPCPKGDKFHNEDGEIIYHDDDCDFNLCTLCARIYMA
ncbi:wd-40 repeat protein [Stylonychia lemnae]|uniref:Wd-40 repeat protein n=1 Tax=Stylonychia lemnae TaxID=5949 RepID=A0A078ARJ1_STYLE|nr:wd-40 repeat protein [Stylonychia lemnae]|eukprot:CDW83468.1 wd-40 repeat protein [Stylonychia lemnae]